MLFEEILHWILFGFYFLFLQHLFVRGWKDSSETMVRFQKHINLHNDYEIIAFETAQVAWFLINVFVYAVKIPLKEQGHETIDYGFLYQWMIFNVLGLMFCILGYSKWSKYTSSIQTILALQLASTTFVLSGFIAPPPIQDWVNALVLSFLFLLQLPCLMVNKIYTGDVSNYQSLYASMLSEMTKENNLLAIKLDDSIFFFFFFLPFFFFWGRGFIIIIINFFFFIIWREKKKSYVLYLFEYPPKNRGRKKEKNRGPNLDLI